MTPTEHILRNRYLFWNITSILPALTAVGIVIHSFIHFTWFHPLLFIILYLTYLQIVKHADYHTKQYINHLTSNDR